MELEVFIVFQAKGNGRLDYGGGSEVGERMVS